MEYVFVIGETKWTAEFTKNLIQLDILKNNPTHAFTLKVLMIALIRDRLRKNFVNIFFSTEDGIAKKPLLFLK